MLFHLLEEVRSLVTDNGLYEAVANGGVLDSYTLQIFWRGDPGTEYFTIKHTNEEKLAQWNTTLQRQWETFTRPGGSDESPQASTTLRAATVTEFAWMCNTNSNDQGRRSEDEYSEDSDDIDGGDTATLVGHPAGGFGMLRNGPNTILRSHAATNEGLHQPQAPMGNLLGTYSRGPPRHTQTGSSNKPPLPPGNYITSHYGNTPTRAGPTPRDGTATTATRTAKNQITQYQTSHRLQRPPLPGMTPSNPVSLQQRDQMRSANGPNIHHVPGRAQLAPSPNGMIPPIPLVPPNYVRYTGGPATANRNQNNSLVSPNILMQGAPVGNGLLAAHELAPWINRHMNGTSKSQGQVKVRVSYGNDKFIILVPYNVSYDELMDRVERKMKLYGFGDPHVSPLRNIRVRYLDSDGDYVQMSSDDDLQMAFDTLGAPEQNDGAGITGVVSLSVSV